MCTNYRVYNLPRQIYLPLEGGTHTKISINKTGFAWLWKQRALTAERVLCSLYNFDESYVNEPDLSWNGQGFSDALQPPERKQKRYEYATFLSSLKRI